jgi:hypothetical protein
MLTYAKLDHLSAVSSEGRHVPNKGQRSTPYEAAMKRGMPSIGGTEITGPAILLHSIQLTGKLLRNTSQSF